MSSLRRWDCKNADAGEKHRPVPTLRLHVGGGQEDDTGNQATQASVTHSGGSGTGLLSAPGAPCGRRAGAQAASLPAALQGGQRQLWTAALQVRGLCPCRAALGREPRGNELREQSTGHRSLSGG